MRKASPPMNEGARWSSLPNELLQTVLSNGDIETVKVARLVCKGWRSAQARLQPCVLVRQNHVIRPGRLALLASACAHSPAGSEAYAHAAHPAPAAASSVSQSTGDSRTAAVDLLRWLSSSFSGQLEQQGTVVLTLQEGREGAANIRDTHSKITSGIAAAPGSSLGASSGTMGQSSTIPGYMSGQHNAGDQGPQAGGSGGETALAAALNQLAASGQQRLRIQHVSASLAAGVTPLTPSGACGPAGGWGALGRPPFGAGNPPFPLRPERTCLEDNSLSSEATSSMVPHSGGCGHCQCCCAAALPPPQRHLPAPGLTAITALQGLRSLELYGISFGPGLLPRLTVLTQLTRLCVDMPLPVNAATELARLSTLHSLHFTVKWPVTMPSPPAAVGGQSSSAAAAVPPRRQPQPQQQQQWQSQRATRYQTFMRQLMTSRDSAGLRAGVAAAGTAVRRSHAGATGLASARTVLVAAPAAAAGDCNAGSGKAPPSASPTAAATEPLTSNSDSDDDLNGDSSCSSQRAQSEDEGRRFELSYGKHKDPIPSLDGDDTEEDEEEADAWSDDDSVGGLGAILHSPGPGRMSGGDFALTADHVLPCLAALAPLPALTDLRLSVCCARMARSLLSPPALLAEARSACPRLRRFGFRVLSEWQPEPKTLYNWLAADVADHSLSRIRDDAAGTDKQVFIWQHLEWCLRQEQERDNGGGVGGAGTATGASSAARNAHMNSGSGASTAAAAAAAAVAEVSAGIRVSGSSWLGSCLDAPAAVDAVAGGLPGARLASLVLEDSCPNQGAAEGLSLRSQEALAGLRELLLRDVRREPPRARQPGARGGHQSGGQDGPADYLSQLMRLPSLTSLGLHTTCARWLDVLLPQPQPQPQPQPEPPLLPQPEPEQLRHSADPLPGGRQQPQQRLRHLTLWVRDWAARRDVPSTAGAASEEGATSTEEDESDGDGAAEVAWDDEGQANGGSRAGAGRRAEPGSPAVSGAAAVMPRLALLSSLCSLELDMPTVLMLQWLPPSLRHLSLTRIELRLPLAGPGGGRTAQLPGRDEADDTEEAGSARESTTGGRRRTRAATGARDLGISTGGDGGGPARHGRGSAACRTKRRRRGIDAAEGLSAEPDMVESASAVCLGAAAGAADLHDDGGGGAGPSCPDRTAAAAAAGPSAPPPLPPPPLLPNLSTLSAARCALPPLSCLLAAAGCTALTSLSLAACRTPLPPGTTPRGAQLLLAAEVGALAAGCGGSLRVLRVMQPGGLLDVSGGRASGGLGGGGGGAAVRVLCEALPRLARLHALCWEVAPEQQERLLGCLGGLRELRELTLCAHVGRTGLQHLRQLTGLRSLLQLCPSRQARGAQAWMRQVEPHLPLCVMKCVPRD